MMSAFSMPSLRSFRRKTTAASLSHSLTHSLTLFSLSSHSLLTPSLACHRRGYLQKSLVLLSRYPFVSLFKSVVRVVAEVFFDQFDHVANAHAADDLLEAVYHNMAKWSSPSHTHTKMKSFHSHALPHYFITHSLTLSQSISQSFTHTLCRPKPEGGVAMELPVLGAVLRFRPPLSLSPLALSPHMLESAALSGPRENVRSGLPPLCPWVCRFFSSLPLCRSSPPFSRSICSLLSIRCCRICGPCGNSSSLANPYSSSLPVHPSSVTPSSHSLPSFLRFVFVLLFF
jgi:hypothetical protein